MKEKIFRAAIVLGLPLMFQNCVTVAPNLESGLRDNPNGYSTEPAVGLGVASNETTAEQLQFAKDQGAAEQRSLEYLFRNAQGKDMMAGEFKVGILLESPKPWTLIEDGNTIDNEAEGSLFLGVTVRDAYDGRSVPGLQVTAKILDKEGNTVDEKTLPYGLFPLLNRYGENMEADNGDDYQIEINILPPDYLRHDPTNGDRYRDTVVAHFDAIAIRPSELKNALEEANEEEWTALATDQGIALERALNAMLAKTAMDGEEIRYGDYLLTYAVEYAEGYWEWKNDRLRYNTKVEQSAETNAHVEVAVRDSRTGRMLPGFKFQTTFMRNGEEVEQVEPGFMWHPWLYHYGQNIRVPATAAYELRVESAPPSLRRYGGGSAERYSSGITYTFKDVNITTGQK